MLTFPPGTCYPCTGPSLCPWVAAPPGTADSPVTPCENNSCRLSENICEIENLFEIERVIKKLEYYLYPVSNLNWIFVSCTIACKIIYICLNPILDTFKISHLIRILNVTFSDSGIGFTLEALSSKRATTSYPWDQLGKTFLNKFSFQINVKRLLISSAVWLTTPYSLTVFDWLWPPTLLPCRVAYKVNIFLTLCLVLAAWRKSTSLSLT